MRPLALVGGILALAMLGALLFIAAALLSAALTPFGALTAGERGQRDMDEVSFLGRLTLGLQGFFDSGGRI